MRIVHRLLLFTFLSFVLASRVPADPPRAYVLRRALDVRRSPDLTAPVIQRLHAGERAWVMSEQSGLARIRYRRDGLWRAGYVEADLLTDEADEELGEWQVGLVGAYSVLSQGARTFQTRDQVQWRTSAYASDTIWPAAFVQWRRVNFWRFALGLRRVRFRGHSSTNVSGAETRPVQLDQDMVSGRLERAWQVMDPAYVTAGVEVARAFSMHARLGGVSVPTTGEDIKFYGGASVGVGASFPVHPRLSGFVEARAGAYPTLSPMAYVFEGAAGLGYWF